MVLVWSMEGMRCSRDVVAVSLLVAAVIMILGETMDHIVVIHHVNNGGYTKEGHSFSLGWTVGPDFSIGQG